MCLRMLLGIVNTLEHTGQVRADLSDELPCIAVMWWRRVELVTNVLKQQV